MRISSDFLSSMVSVECSVFRFTKYERKTALLVAKCSFC